MSGADSVDSCAAIQKRQSHKNGHAGLLLLGGDAHDNPEVDCRVSVCAKFKEERKFKEEGAQKQFCPIVLMPYCTAQPLESLASCT